MSTPEIALPKAKPVTIDANKSALLVLDLGPSCADPKQACHKLVPRITKLLDNARAAGVPIVFTMSAHLKGKPEGEVYSGFKRQPSEVVLFPDGFDKFVGGELQNLLRLYDIDTIIVTGYRCNISVLHTATKAARELNYDVIIPIDGLAALTEFEEQYTLFHFTVLPARAGQHFTFTTVDMISFRSPAY